MSSPTENPKLHPFSYVVLALIGERGAGAHDLVRMMRQGRVYWAASESHYYAEPKRLERLGLLRSEKRPGVTTQRTHYMLTEPGREALVQWLGQPAAFTRIQSEAIVKVLASDLTDDASVAASIGALRAQIEELEAGVAESEQMIPDLPHRARNLRLVHRYGRAMLDLHRQWVEEVERELGGRSG
jgi:PadR family transcriptional regulator, regulatory protein AphA